MRSISVLLIKAIVITGVAFGVGEMLQSCSHAHASSIQVPIPFLFSNIRTATTTDTMSNSDGTVLCDTSGGAFTEKLPPTPAKGQIENVKLINSTNLLTINGNGANIDGSATISTSTRNQSFQIQFDGTAWWII